MIKSSHCILALEDNTSDYLLLSLAARKTGIHFDLQRVTKPEEALAYLEGRGVFGDRTQHPLPCFLVTNLKLYGTFAGGHDFIREIRQQPAFRSLPIIVLSGTIDEKDIESAYRAGANVFLNKTASLEELVGMIRGLLSYFCPSNPLV